METASAQWQHTPLKEGVKREATMKRCDYGERCRMEEAGSEEDEEDEEEDDA